MSANREHDKRAIRPFWVRILRDTAIVVPLVLISAGAYVYFSFSRPAGSGPAGPAVSRARFQEEWTSRPCMLVGFGDSITDGYGASPQHSYFELLVKNSADESLGMRGLCLSGVLPNLRATNMSVSGSVSLQHIDKQIRPFPVQSNVYGIVVMTTGGNDIIHQYGRSPPSECAMYGASYEQALPWIRNFRVRLDQMISAVIEKFPDGCQIFLANIYDPTDGTGDPGATGLPPWPDALRVLKAYNDIIADCTERHGQVHLVDIHTPFLGHGIHCTKFWNSNYHISDPCCWFDPNIEDPNDRGYDAIRRLFLNRMSEVLPGV